MRETAYAKINLALNMIGRRDDGYHELETLFAFVDAGDEISAREADQDRVEVSGEFAGTLTDPFDNLVMKALAALPRAGGLVLMLEKNLPVAAGLGGGSADAGAVFRIVERLYGLPDDWPQRAAKLGADVPACVRSEACIGSGTGTALAPITNDMAGMAVLLVNPRVPLSTADVFAAWDGEASGALSGETVQQITAHNGNDLERVVVDLMAITPVRDCLDALSTTGASLVRMSGSGATCFALYDDEAARDEAARRIAKAQPAWWQMAGRLR